MTETRTRKAWKVRARGYDGPGYFFAPTAGKARYLALRSLGDSADDITFYDLTAIRAPDRDVHLPARDPIADQISEQEAHCLLHAFGANCGDPTKAGRRDYFYTRRDDPPLVSLTERGLMEPLAGDQLGNGMTYFILTDLGKHVALSMVPEYP